MDFRRKLGSPDSIVYERLSDIAEKTLCPKSEGEEFHRKECLMRECSDCGVGKSIFLPEEQNMSDGACRVEWKKFEYVEVGINEEGKKKKLQLVDKKTSPGEMFFCLKELLNSYVPHQFRAIWQHKQSRELHENLPLNHVSALHDYSENYNCQMQNEVQSLYYGQVQSSIHVTILRRHALKDVDGLESTLEKPEVITEHLFVISPDLKHDHHSVHQARKYVHNYLNDIHYPVKVMHEWTDGCSARTKVDIAWAM